MATDPRGTPGTQNPDGGNKGETLPKKECLKCGDSYGQLALHLPTCDGGDDDAE